MNDQDVTPMDVLITLAVGVALALALEAPQALRPATGGAATTATAVPRRTVAGTLATAGAPRPDGSDGPLGIRTVAVDALTQDGLLGEVQSRLDAADVRGIVAWVPPGDGGFEVWDFAEREPPLVAGPIAAAVLLDGLFARSLPAPRVEGWFGDAAAPEHLGVVTCCWQREPGVAPSPAGWLLDHTGGRTVLRQWVWLGAPGDGATVDDLVGAWAASGEWEGPSAAGPRPPVPFTRVLWPAPDGR